VGLKPHLNQVSFIMAYCVLAMLEKAGKRKKVAKAQLAELAARWAVALTVLLIFINGIIVNFSH
jgi:hypothetical protein